MTGITLLEKHPKTAELIREWFTQKMYESLDDKLSFPITDNEFKEEVKKMKILDKNVASIVDGNPRAFFDIFDEHKIYIDLVVSYYKPIGEPAEFTYRILDRDIDKDSDSTIWYSTRKEAEKAAIIDAFGLLEEQLTN